MDRHREEDIRALVYLLTYAKLEAVRLDLWDAAHRINQGLASIVGGHADVLGSTIDADSSVSQSAPAQPPAENS